MQRKAAKEGSIAAEMCSSQTGFYEQNKKETYYCSYLGHQNEVNFVGGISERRPKGDRFVFIRLFRIRGPISPWEGGREGRTGVLNEEAGVVGSCQNIK